ncbi:MAG: 30S ribosomal protein S16 [Mycoplasmataceae bacterium RC_NB112A]|nr:MAG: 30S ribosomal protein S16 [Mycoplasmataceae bacterium RC_NB112A]
MVVRIRLVPVGKKVQRSYQIKVIDSPNPRGSGNFLEHLGHWNPAQKKMELDQESYQKWIQRGAQPTDSLNLRYNKVAIVSDLENLPTNRIKISFPFANSETEKTFKVKELRQKIKENNYWLIKGTLLDKWKKGLVEKIFKNDRFRLLRLFSQTGKEIKREGETSLSAGPFNFEFSITLPKEEQRSQTLYTTKNNPLSVIEPPK